MTIGPGTLYGALTTLERENLIEFVAEAQRRKSYRLTARGAPCSPGNWCACT